MGLENTQTKATCSWGGFSKSHMNHIRKYKTLMVLFKTTKDDSVHLH